MPQDPESSEITTRPPLAKLTGELVQPPSRVYLTVDDRLYIRSRNSLTAVTLQVAGRLLRADGTIVPFNFEHVPATDRTASLESFRLAEGFLLSVVVFPSVGAPLRGQTFVELGLLRGRDAAAAVVDVLARDYVSEGEPLAFPGAPIRSSIEGPGVIRSITGTDPAATVAISEAVPTDARWRFIAAELVLTTDANVANRRVSIRFNDGSNIYSRLSSRSTQAASVSNTYDVGAFGFFENSVSGVHVIAIPSGIFMSAGHTWGTLLSSVQAADDFAAPQYLVEEWIQD